MRLGAGDEFEIIRELLGPLASLPPGVLVGPGDDCAVLEGGLVASVDLTVEGIHFKREWISLEEAGFRATSSALSDLAAMAARPLGVFLSMALEAQEARSAAARLQAGAGEACREVGTQILGGDLSESPGPLFLDIAVLGQSSSPVLRAGCEAGDEVWVTGQLGGSAGAVALWSREMDPPTELRKRFARPRPRIGEALWLAERVSLHGLVDLSDGLGGDAGHLAAASGVRLLLDRRSIPLDPALADFADLPGIDPLRLALFGGEDYELCLTAAAGAVGPHAAAFEESFGLTLTRIGVVAEGAGVYLLEDDGRIEPIREPGFSHFSREIAG